jgi:hypothetical protein
MPFDDDETKPSKQSQKIGLKKVAGQKSVFDDMPKKPTHEQFQEKVKEAADRNSGYKQKAAELATMFNKAMTDKTLPENKNILYNDTERELLQKMVQLAIDINNDPNEQEGMGSLSWITLLLKTCFAQRDKINVLDHAIFQLQKRTDPAILLDLVRKEITASLDKKKTSE